MKVRIEQERIPPGEDPQFHLKLGRGSLSDVEFTVQLLQLQMARCAARVAAHPGDDDGADGLVAVGLLEPDDDGDAARVVRVLLGGPQRPLPRDRQARDALRWPATSPSTSPACSATCDRPQATLRDDYRRVTRHARQVVERVFYGRT